MGNIHTFPNSLASFQPSFEQHEQYRVSTNDTGRDAILSPKD
jgi:hypothetical protein